MSKRTLYTDDDETVLDAIRPVIVNGIDDIANRPDLAERCLVLTLQPIARAKRRDEETFWRAFIAAAPRILGMLLDGVVSALRRLPEVQIPELPRMADFAKWIAAAEPGLGLPSGTLLAACERNRARVVDVALAASPVGTAVRRLLDWPKQGGKWEGEPSQLLTALADLVPEDTRKLPSWPKTANALSGRLRRAATFLRSVGVTVDLDGHAGRGADRHRVWRLAKIEGTGETVPTDPTSPTAENGPRSGDAGANPDRPRDRPPDGPGAGGDDAGTQADWRPSPPGAWENGFGGRGDDGDDGSHTPLGGGCFDDLLDRGVS